MSAGDLTTLSNVKAWAGVTETTDDALLARLISSASRAILNYLNRGQIVSTLVTEYFDGRFPSSRPLKSWPVTDVASVTICGQSLTASPLPSSGISPQPGFIWVPWNGSLPGAPSVLSLYGYLFSSIPAGNCVIYTAGYQTTEAGVIPATPYQIATSQTFAADGGVTKNGAAMVAVTANPSTGQYVAPVAGVSSTYTFAAADATHAVSITYSFTPADLEEACYELVSERYRYKDRIGQASRVLAGQETVSYNPNKFPQMVLDLLNPYKQVLPL